MKTLQTLALALLAVVAGGAAAQTAWPTAKPIRLIVGYPPGGGIDFAARTVQVPLQEALKQQIVVDYKPGAGGMLAAGELTRAAPDGYTLLLANTRRGCRRSRPTTRCASSRTSGRSARAATSPSRGPTIRPTT